MIGRATIRRLALALAPAVAAAAGAAARAQDVPRAISPIDVASDRNGVNLLDGRIAMELPVLAVPAAPNLRFDRVQNAAPHISGNVIVPPGSDNDLRTYAVHTGAGTSDQFECRLDPYCTNLTESGATFNWLTRQYRAAGSGALYQFGPPVTTSNPTRPLHYATSVTYPNGEIIAYSYASGGPAGGIGAAYRPAGMTSNLGYYITLTYRADDFQADFDGWMTLAQARLYAAGATPVLLGRLSYSGATITDHGDRPADDPAPGRVYACTGCNNGIGLETEVNAATSLLPGEAAPALAVAPVTNLPDGGLVPIRTVTRDGVQWTYSYTGLAYQWKTLGYTYTGLTVTGPDNYRQVYAFTATGRPHAQRNVLAGLTDSLDRTTAYGFAGVRPVSIVYPEGNRIDLVYDPYGNIVERRAAPRPGTGAAIVESADYPAAICADPYSTTPILCWRPTASRDARQHRTDYAYNARGQPTEQIDPADAAGVRRRTSIAYALSGAGLSRRSAVRICADTGASCGANAPIQTEYDYWGDTFLVAAERRIDAAAGVTLETRYAYDPAGRLVSADGPLPGSDDTAWNRYDAYGRRTWEIGALGADGLRIAARHFYRDSDDRPVAAETGTLDSLADETLDHVRRTDTAYDARRNPVRETVSAGGTLFAATDRSWDLSGRPVCTAIRMNLAALPPLAALDACAPGQEGTGADAFGPDRIGMTVYDAAGQRLQHRVGVGYPDVEAAEASWEYNGNGQVRAVIDGNGNRAELRYDGYGRQDRWTFPSANGPAGTVNPNDYEEYGYDAAGNRTSLRKRDGSVLTYHYDDLNRLIRKTVPERAGLTAAQTRDVFYGYDLRNLQLYARFDSASGPGIVNAYDGFGRLASTTTDVVGGPRRLSYQYDAAGRRTRITHPDGPFFTYDYGPAGRLTGINQLGGSDVLSVYYHPTGERYVLGRGLTALGWLHDPVGRLTYQVADLAGEAGDTIWTFQRNPASGIARVTRSNDAYAWGGHYGVARSYATNGLNQYSSTASTTATGQSTASFSYDLNGNLLTTPGPNGQTIAYTYDVENRLVAASGGVQLGYDPLGRLAWTTGSPNFTSFLYDGDALVAEYGSGGTVTERYVHGPGADEPWLWYHGATVGHANLRLPFADAHGSVVAVGTYMGELLAINRYDEYGIPAATNTGRFQYTGQTWLAELGLYHYKARLYSPGLGRFLQTDPIGYQGGTNLYGYVGNDPVNRSDPTGQYQCPTEPGCDAAKSGISEIKQAQRYYLSPAIGSRFARDPGAARALGEVLSSLGERNDGGVIITVGSLAAGRRAEYHSESNTITLDTAQIRSTGGRIGESLGHEAQHYRQRRENLDTIPEEVRPFAMERLISVTPGGSVSSSISEREYIRFRITNGSYCDALSAGDCNSAIDRAMNDELPKPF